MASLNKVMLIGNCGKSADLRYTANGVATATFSLAVNNRRRGQSGEWEDQTEWFNIVLFAETAERLAQYILKGKPLYVEGRMQTRTWDHPDTGVKQYRPEVIASTVQLLGSRDAEGEGQGGYQGEPKRARYEGRQPAPNSRNTAAVDDIDDLPFE